MEKEKDRKNVAIFRHFLIYDLVISLSNNTIRIYKYA